jgi:hypothetical protein
MQVRGTKNFRKDKAKTTRRTAGYKATLRQLAAYKAARRS